MASESTTQPDETPDAASSDAARSDAAPSEVGEATPLESPTPASTDVSVAPAAPQVIYVQTPPPPKRAGNRGVGSLLAILSTVIYAALFAVIVAVIFAAERGALTFVFLGSINFYVPVLFFLVASVLVVLVVNRAGWAAHVVASLVVGLVVYFGTIGVLLLGQGVILGTAAQAAVAFADAARNPIVIAAALLAREVALWSGALIGRRGRSLVQRNRAAREAWEREVAETKAAHERSAAAV